MIGGVKDDAVVIEFVITLQVDATISLLADHVEAEIVDIMGNRSVDIEYVNLDKTRTQYAFTCHHFLPFGAS